MTQRPTEVRPFRIAFLVGKDDRPTRSSIEAVCKLTGVAPVAVLVDTGRPSFRQRFKNLRRNIVREGWSYLPHRLLAALRSATDIAVERAAGVTQQECLRLLARAFPAERFSLDELGGKYGFQVLRVGNLNGVIARQALTDCGAHLGIVLGTRILKQSTFAIPLQGCINLHKGRVPEYRGLPPGFWELYDGASAAGVTVHSVDATLDTGAIVATSEVPILKWDTPDTPQTSRSPRTRPTRKQIGELRRRLPHWNRLGDSRVVVKNLGALLTYCLGVYSLVRTVRRWRGKSRAAVLLYHRVNDYSNDVLTVGRAAFAAQLLAVARRYAVVPTAALVAALRQPAVLTPTTVVLHFDDCYRDVYLHGAPLLKAVDLSATAFVSSGFVGTDRAFQHDREKYPFTYGNLHRKDLRSWTDLGFDVGAHTVNHVDLGRCNLDQSRREIVESGRELEAMIGRPVVWFSFPFGGLGNINDEARRLIRDSGYQALFSAHGSFVGQGTSLYDIPRIGVTGAHAPLHLLLEIEGLTARRLVEAARRILRVGR
jgi:peptidoglycan/xylan/chitin deacetylase (PgdA/CDA1 family)